MIESLNKVLHVFNNNNNQTHCTLGWHDLKLCGFIFNKHCVHWVYT